ncbi:hypothetical protein J2Y58_000227 [Sphingomonas sp. BE138]|nr:hypothetical protein [Sphingomonas sp. BE138]
MNCFSMATFDAIVMNGVTIAAMRERFRDAEHFRCVRSRGGCDEPRVRHGTPSYDAGSLTMPVSIVDGIIVQRMGTRFVQARERERQERLAMMGKALRSSVRVPTDTYITGDIPTLLTRLGQVPAVPETKRS